MYTSHRYSEPYLSLGSKSFRFHLIVFTCHFIYTNLLILILINLFVYIFQVEHYKEENEELVRKYEKTKEELEEAIEKLNEEVHAQRSETQLHISKLQRHHTLSEQKYMEEVFI
jgi:uncharacterized membrane protein (DUF106 family)